MAYELEVTIHSDDHFDIEATEDGLDSRTYQLDVARTHLADMGQTWCIKLIDPTGSEVKLPPLHCTPSIASAVKWACTFLIQVVHEEDENLWPTIRLVLGNGL